MRVFVISVVACVTTAACSSSDDTIGVTANGDKGGGGAMLTLDGGGLSSSGGARRLDGGGPPTTEDNCGDLSVDTTRSPADVLLVLDRSLSMLDSIDSGVSCEGKTNCVSRWSAVTTALGDVLSGTRDSVYWGLKFYTSPNAPACPPGEVGNCGLCYVSPGVEVPLNGKDNASAIVGAIAASVPATNTPTHAAIDVASEYLAGVSGSHPKYILLATDGEPNCLPGKTNTELENTGPAIQSIERALAKGWKTFVVGIAPTGRKLNALATAGGTQTFYSAESPQGLVDAFRAISKAVGTCTFTAATVPPDPGNVAVYVDKALIPNSATQGWVAGANPATIVLTGDYCDRVLSGKATSVRILFGCPGGVEPPVVIP